MKTNPLRVSLTKNLSFCKIRCYWCTVMYLGLPEGDGWVAGCAASAGCWFSVLRECLSCFFLEERSSLRLIRREGKQSPMEGI